MRDEPWRIEEEGGPYADTLLVTGTGERLRRAARSLRPDEMSETTDGWRLWWD